MKIARDELTGIILAGGKSKRMGRDKSLISLGGKPLVSHVQEALHTVCGTLLLISADPRLDALGIPRYEDLIPGVGPLAGLYTGLYHSRNEYNLVLGCDTPLVSQALLEYLIDAVEPGDEVVQLATSKSKMPLLACYRRVCMDKILGFIQAGERRMQESVARLETRTLMLTPAMEPYAMNINNPDDLRKAREFGESNKF